MGHCFLRVSDCAVFSAANWPPLYQGEVNIYRQTGGGKEGISLFAVYTKGCFIFAPLHGIYSLNLSNVICTVTESAVLISYIPCLAFCQDTLFIGSAPSLLCCCVCFHAGLKQMILLCDWLGSTVGTKM